MAALGIAGAVALAGCGSSRSNTSSTPAGAAHASSAPSARAIAQHALLRISDFPSGWVATPTRRRSSQPTLSAEVAACLHIPASEVARPSDEVRSPRFHGPRGQSVGSSADVAATEARARRSISLVARPGATACLASAFDRSVREGLGSGRLAGVSIGRAAVRTLPMPRVGDESVALRITIPLAAAGRRLPVIVDGIELRVGRADASITTMALGAPPPQATDLHLAGLVATRLASALGRPVGA